MSTNTDRAERGRAIVMAYDGGENLSRLMTDLAAYAATLGPNAFDNNVHIARTRVAAEEPDPVWVCGVPGSEPCSPAAFHVSPTCGWRTDPCAHGRSRGLCVQGCSRG